MRIFFSCIAFDGGKSGISEYMLSTLKEMLKAHHVDVLIDQDDLDVFPIQHSNLSFLPLQRWLKRPVLSMFWHLFIIPLCYKLSSYDLVFLPAGNRRLFFRAPKQTVVTFHDLSQFHIPGKYDALRMYYIRHVIPHYLKKIKHIFAISENTKNDLIRYYFMDPQRIKVNYNAFDPAKLDRYHPEADIREKYKLTRPYLLYISRIEHPGKNHLNLIKAFEILPASLSNSYDLVLAGSDWNGSDQVHSYAIKSTQRERIRFLGFVPNEDLASLYHYASLYVFPSFYEGFGIPILEAMYCGVPVICSNRSSLPEIGGEAVLTFDPELPADIASRIKDVIANEKLTNRMIADGKLRIRAFSWQEHVQRILATIK